MSKVFYNIIIAVIIIIIIIKAVYNNSKNQHTCRVGASSTWYVANRLRLKPRVVYRIKHLNLRAVQFTVGMIRPSSITTTTEYVHFVADASC